METFSKSYIRYWGKSDSKSKQHHILLYHCLDTAAVGKKFVDSDSRLSSLFSENPLFKENPCLLPFLLAVHDVGKFSKQFQEKIQNQIDNLAGHTEESFALLRSELVRGTLQQFFARYVSDSRSISVLNENLISLFEAVSGHHGMPVSINPLNQDESLYDIGTENRKDAAAFIQELAEFFLHDFVVPAALTEQKKECRKSTKNLSWLLAGVCVVSDWIASNNLFFKWRDTECPIDVYWESALCSAEEAVLNAGLIPSPASGLTTTKELFGFTPRNLQKVIEELPVSSGPNLYIIEESTGGGKTEAALLLAEKLIAAGCGNGFYFALPTMATANAMYYRIAGPSRLYEKFYSGSNQVSVVLSHGQRILSDRYQDFLSEYEKSNPEKWLYDTNKKALLSSIGIGTIDQALMGVLPWKHQSLRLLGCARNILIVDEVHAYDTYMNSLLENLLKFHKACGGSVILLSATLPKVLKEKFIAIYSTDSYSVPDSLPYPLITHVNGSGTVENISVQPSPDKETAVSLVYSEDEVIDCLISAAESGGCACWIRNTVADAVEAFHLLKCRTSFPVHLFHARFTMEDRLNHESDVLELFGKLSVEKTRAGHILIATQVVEQSLDLDFDFMVSDLAPVDLIIQRAGRLWRHDRVRPSGFTSPEFLIYSPNPDENISETWYSSLFRGGSFVYAEHGKLWKTANLLKNFKGFAMPRDARMLIDSVYDADDSGIPDVLRMIDEKAITDKKISDAHAQRRSLNLSKGYKSDDYLWSKENPALTREGEPSVLLELYKAGENGNSVLWSEEAGIKGELMSRVAVSVSMITENYLRNYEKDINSDVLKISFIKSGNIWKPTESVFKKETYYSEEEGLVQM